MLGEPLVVHAATSQNRRTRGSSRSTTLASARLCAPCRALALPVLHFRSSILARFMYASVATRDTGAGYTVNKSKVLCR